MPPATTSSFRLSDAERLLIIAKLSSVFPGAELNAGAAAPRPGTFLDRIRQPAFWQAGEQEPALTSGGAAVDFYLQYCFGEEHVATLERCFGVCARSFFDARHDRESARDILLFFLYQNFDLLMHLFILHQPQQQHLEASAEALQACFSAPPIAELMLGAGFSKWVLEQWLPSQLRRHHALARQIAPSAVTLSCDDVTSAKNEEEPKKADAAGKQRLVEISRDGVKLSDPCQKQPETGQKTR